MPEKILFVLAGYRAAGKTTFNVNALRQNLNIFGEQYNSVFQTTKIPPHFPERDLGFRETLAHGSWFTSRHFAELTRLTELPDHVVLHVDLITLAITNRFFPGQATPRNVTLHDLADEANNLARCVQFFTNPFFARFDRVVVNTLVTSWEQNTRQWQKRRDLQRGIDARRQAFFDPDAPRPDVHRALYNGWFESLKTLKPTLALMSQATGTHIDIKRMEFR